MWARRGVVFNGEGPIKGGGAELGRQDLWGWPVGAESPGDRA